MNTEIIIALQLILAHVFNDFVLQSQKLLAQKKQKKVKSPFLYFHAFLAGAITYLVLQDWYLWWPPLLIMVTHFLIDLWKLSKNTDTLKYFILDQLFHLLVLLFIWLAVTNNFENTVPYLTNLFKSTGFLALLISYLLVVFPVGFLIGKATQRWQEEIAGDEGEFPSLKKAGRYIGIFERILVLTFILSNNFSAIGFLIAAKSILRFSEKSKSGARKQTEYVLIGTLMSFALTIIIGFLCNLVISS